MTRVLVTAPSSILRAGLAALLGTSPTLTVITNPLDALNSVGQLEQLRPDVVLIAIESSDDPALDLLHVGSGVLVPVVVLVSEDATEAWASDLLRIGVRAILPSTSGAGEMVAAVEAVAAGLVVLHPDFVDNAAGTVTGGSPVLSEPPGQALTPREAEILTMIAGGLGNKEIAWRLGISEHTVKFHVSSILTKLGASGHTEALTLGIRLGLILI